MREIKAEGIQVPYDSPTEEASEDGLQVALRELKAVTGSLKQVSVWVSLATLMHASFALTFVFYLLSFRVKLHPFESLAWGFLDISFVILVVSFLFVYDRSITRGEAIYQEISDELEWHVRGLSSVKAQAEVYNSTKERPGISVRLALREFVAASRLPLIRGSNAGNLYLLINVMVAALTLFMIFNKTVPL